MMGGLSQFIVQALSNKHITVFGDGFQTRSFCYVSDMVDGFLRFMNTPKDLLGHATLKSIEISILELAEIIRELLGSSVDIVHKELPIDDPMRRKPCIKIANEKLSWSPKINIKDGIAKISNTLKISNDNAFIFLLFSHQVSKSSVFILHIQNKLRD